MAGTVDLSDGMTFASGFPHPFFTRLREHEPLYWHEPTEHTPDGEGFWVVSRYDDIVRIFLDPATFSSDRVGERRGGGTALFDDTAAGYMLNMTDDPRHRRLRGLVNQGFTPRKIAEFESAFRQITRDLLDRAAAEDSVDFVEAVARELPLQAICLILGVPQEDRGQLIDWLDKGIETQDERIIALDYIHQILGYAETLIEAKRRDPGNDILSAITHATLVDESGAMAVPLTNRELRLFFILLFPAGAETTRSAIAGAVLAFIRHPDQLARLRVDSFLLRPAIEEIVRWTTPSIYKRRTATRDVVLHGRTIRAGDKVTVWEMSANRDERVFDRPFTFDVARSPNRHLGFGTGVHFCLGAHLARLEIRIMLEELLGRFDRFELVGEPAWMPNNRLLGLKQLPVKLV